MTVNSLNDSIAALRAAGVTDAASPEPPDNPDTPRTVIITDPDGNQIELVQWPQGHADGITTADWPTEPTNPTTDPTSREVSRTRTMSQDARGTARLTPSNAGYRSAESGCRVASGSHQSATSNHVGRSGRQVEFTTHTFRRLGPRCGLRVPAHQLNLSPCKGQGRYRTPHEGTRVVRPGCILLLKVPHH